MSKTTFCVIQCTPTKETCEWLNQQKPEGSQYSSAQISQLLQRYEVPDSKFRWEKPLFEIKVGRADRPCNENDLDDMSLDLEHLSPRFANIFDKEIVDWICNGTELTENQSTQVVPLAPTNFLHELDRSTQDTITVLLNAQRTAVRGQKIVIPGAGGSTVNFSKPRTVQELNRLRHQFVSMSKKNPTADNTKIVTMFVDFLNSNLR
uniref:Protein KTI12 homolog n=1 Tax=Caenorhabditis japonica TaxID=281687 RepID=A0A8R1DFJ8_CAEJA